MPITLPVTGKIMASFEDNGRRYTCFGRIERDGSTTVSSVFVHYQQRFRRHRGDFVTRDCQRKVLNSEANTAAQRRLRLLAVKAIVASIATDR